MNTYEVELNGFNGGTDKTNHLIKWINAGHLEQVQDYIGIGNYQNITKLDRLLTKADGVDTILPWFHNEYICPKCGIKWTDEWDCCCDDTCPGCECSDISPFNSIEDK